MWGLQDTVVPTPPLLLLPNNILVLSELQDGDSSISDFVEEGVCCRRGLLDCPLLEPGSAGGSPRWCPVLWREGGRWSHQLCQRGPFLRSSWPQ